MKNRERNPWRTHLSRVVYQNPWITLREDQVTRPDGTPGIYSVVETHVATGAVALTPEGCVYLVGQYRYATNSYSWEIIEGGAHSQESPLEGAKRELLEEAGLTAEKWQQLGSLVHLSNCFTNEKAVLFLAEGLTQGTPKPEGTEELLLRLVPLSECLEMVSRGEITDAMSIIALYRANELLQARTCTRGL